MIKLDKREYNGVEAPDWAKYVSEAYGEVYYFEQDCSAVAGNKFMAVEDGRFSDVCNKLGLPTSVCVYSEGAYCILSIVAELPPLEPIPSQPSENKIVHSSLVEKLLEDQLAVIRHNKEQKETIRELRNEIEFLKLELTAIYSAECKLKRLEK